jgi:hypothetical protein
MSVALVVPFMNVRNWTTLSLTAATILAAMLWLAIGGKRKQVDPLRTIATTAMIAIAFTRIAGAYMFTPVVITGSLLALTANRGIRNRPSIVFAWLAFVIAAPLVLELADVFRTTSVTHDTELCTQSPIFLGQGHRDGIALLVVNTVLLASMAGYALRLNREVADTRTELNIQAWHLNQLLPRGK